MSISQYGLDQTLGTRLDQINSTLHGIAYFLVDISKSLEWIASCHYQQFSPTAETTSTRPTPHIAPRKPTPASTFIKIHQVEPDRV